MIELIGKVEKVERNKFKVNGKPYTEVVVSVKRDSGTCDNIILVYLANRFKVLEGTYVRVVGDVRTYKEESETFRTRAKVAVSNLNKVNYDELSETEKTLNVVADEVMIIRASKMRRTPNRLRITDLRVGKTNTRGKLYTYAAIAWGSIAKDVSDLPYGTKIKLQGRLQERKYQKKIDGKVRTLNTYEVSISDAVVF